MKSIENLVEKCIKLCPPELEFEVTEVSSSGSTYARIAYKASLEATGESWPHQFSELGADEIWTVRVSNHDRQLSSIINHATPDFAFSSRDGAAYNTAKIKRMFSKILDCA